MKTLQLICILTVVLLSSILVAEAQTNQNHAQTIYQKLNDHRLSVGVAPLARNPALDAAAQQIVQTRFQDCFDPGGHDNAIVSIAGLRSWQNVQPIVATASACDAVMAPQAAFNDLMTRLSFTTQEPLLLDAAYREVGIAVVDMPNTGNYPLRNYFVVVAAQPDSFPAVYQNNVLYLPNEQAVQAPSGPEIRWVSEVRINGCQGIADEWRSYEQQVPCQPTGNTISVVSRGPDRNDAIRESLPALVQGISVPATSTRAQMPSSTPTSVPTVTPAPPTATPTPMPPTPTPTNVPETVDLYFMYTSTDFTIYIVGDSQRIYLQGLEFRWTPPGTTSSQSLSPDSFPQLRDVLDNARPGQCIQFYWNTVNPNVAQCDSNQMVAVALPSLDHVFWGQNRIFSAWQNGQHIGACSWVNPGYNNCLVQWINTPSNRMNARVDMSLNWSSPDMLLIRFNTNRPTIDLRNIQFSVYVGPDAVQPNNYPTEYRLYNLVMFEHLNEQVNIAAFPSNHCIALGAGDIQLSNPRDEACAHIYIDNGAVDVVGHQSFWHSRFPSFEVRFLDDSQTPQGVCNTAQASCEVRIR